MRIILLVYVLLIWPFAVTAKESNTIDVQFDVAWDKFQPSSIDFRPLIHDAPAGKHGHVVARGDALYFENGKAAKFWGVGLTFSANKGFPPEKEDAEAMAKRLARLGFNHVRLVGLDDSGRWPILTWLKTGRLEHEYLDRLGYFIAKLKEQGIYYSFSINNNSVVLLNDVLGKTGNSLSRNKLW